MVDFPANPTDAIGMDLAGFGKNSARLKAVLKTFRMRSPDREVTVDRARMTAVVGAIDGAIQDMVAERTGLIARVKAIVVQPQPVSTRRFRPMKTPSEPLAAEFLRAEQRLIALARQISDLDRLKASVVEIFPT
jgi:hypothetical protein